MLWQYKGKNVIFRWRHRRGKFGKSLPEFDEIVRPKDVGALDSRERKPYDAVPKLEVRDEIVRRADVGKVCR